MRSGLIVVWRAVLTAGVMAVVPVPGHAADESRLFVDYDPPRLSVTARDVGLLELLGAIGAKVGFTVAEARATSPPVTITIEGAPVDDVLRQLLRTENHTILYRQGPDASAGIDRIVLQGAPGEPGSTPVASAGPTAAPGPAAVAPSAPSHPAAPPTAVVAAPTPAEASGAGPAADDHVTVGDMLKSHALAGLPLQPAVAAAPAAPSSPSVPPSLEETLAITTRRAQQGLNSLVEGLEKATRSLQQQPPAPASGR